MQTKFIATKISKFKGEGNTIIQLMGDGDLAYEEIKNCDKIEVTFRPYKSKRSIEQNRMLWALLTKIAVRTQGTERKSDTMEIYAQMLEETNVKHTYIMALEETKPQLEQVFRVVVDCGERKVNGKTLKVYRCYEGSSKYNTEEMSRLIDCCLDRCNELGIYDSEVEAILKEYRK